MSEKEIGRHPADGDIEEGQDYTEERCTEKREAQRHQEQGGPENQRKQERETGEKERQNTWRGGRQEKQGIERQEKKRDN